MNLSDQRAGDTQASRAETVADIEHSTSQQHGQEKDIL